MAEAFSLIVFAPDCFGLIHCIVTTTISHDQRACWYRSQLPGAFDKTFQQIRICAILHDQLFSFSPRLNQKNPVLSQLHNHIAGTAVHCRRP